MLELAHAALSMSVQDSDDFLQTRARDSSLNEIFRRVAMAQSAELGPVPITATTRQRLKIGQLSRNLKI